LRGGWLAVVLVRAIGKTEEWRRKKGSANKGKRERNPKKTPTHARSSGRKEQRNGKGNATNTEA